MMSVKLPPPILISSTPPSQPASNTPRWRNDSWADCDAMAIAGDTSTLSLTTDGSSMKAELGALSAAGARAPAVFDVTQAGAGPCTTCVDQPAGNAGAVTPSNHSLKEVVSKHVGDRHVVTVVVVLLEMLTLFWACE